MEDSDRMKNHIQTERYFLQYAIVKSIAFLIKREILGREEKLTIETE